MKTMITTRAALKIAYEMIDEAAIPGLHDKAGIEHRLGRENDSMSFTYRLAFGIEVTLYVRMQIVGNAEKGKALPVEPKIEVMWASSGMSAGKARAAVALYSKVTDLACAIEARLGDETIGYGV